ncbi:hypothetical protein [Ruminococcus sp.]|uniref:hypothetical protein n=1 Tax=Ruminococcus sp. TaxID=41978 RepID=UPI0025DBD310|nr:hypothetical protein [Ruminococcus sp.]MBQ8967289.1 hypothetical protein [Ruminococcus sp.]
MAKKNMENEDFARIGKNSYGASRKDLGALGSDKLNGIIKEVNQEVSNIDKKISNVYLNGRMVAGHDVVLQDMESQREKLTKYLDKLYDVRGGIDEHIAVLEAKIKTAESKVKSNEEEISTKTSLMKELGKKVTRMDNDNRVGIPINESEKDSALSQIGKLETRLEAINEENSALKQNISDFKRQIDELKKGTSSNKKKAGPKKDEQNLGE